MDRTEPLWKIHAYLNEYIRFADTKAGLVIAWTSALIGALLSTNFHKRFGYDLAGATRLIGCVLLAMAFIAAFMVVMPRLHTTQRPGFIFWKNILAHKSKDKFVEGLGGLSNNDLEKQVAGHVYDLAGISDWKYWWVNLGIGCAFVGSLVTGLMYVLG